MIDIDEFILGEYRGIVDAAADDGVKRPEAVAEIAERAAKAIADGTLDLPSDVVERIVGRAINDHDNHERRGAAVRMEYVAGALRDETILGRDDPILDGVAQVGNGIRKTWRHVGIDDITAMIEAKTEHAAAAAVAANEFARHGGQVIRCLMKLGHGATIGALAA